ncbi:MAG: hypothetical protein HXY44_14760 [Syntrophaceae bacterium]|nr:hypothetical protein [Syntrophaceae bacterium]
MKWPFFKKGKWNLPQRKVFWAVIAVAMGILIYVTVVLPLSEAAKKSEEEILLKKKVLIKYQEFLQNRKTFEEELERTSKVYEAIQQRLLQGETVQLGSAHLQEIVKRLSDKNGINLRSFRILEPKEMNVYRKISMQIEFNPVPSLLNLSQFIYDIEHDQKELMISEMDLMALNPRMPNSIQGSFVISGLMRIGETKERGKKS